MEDSGCSKVVHGGNEEIMVTGTPTTGSTTIVTMSNDAMTVMILVGVWIPTIDTVIASRVVTAATATITATLLVHTVGTTADRLVRKVVGAFRHFRSQIPLTGA